MVIRIFCSCRSTFVISGDGQIDQTELREIIKSCVAENGMEFDEELVNDLAEALFRDAVKPGNDGITVDDLSDQFKKHKGLLENLTLSIGMRVSLDSNAH